ncbi:DUF262 domain-containing protein [Pseudomonas entomophila]|uniref:DUF262 domain-containing protein n=1 Tax=Pseudomonas entomophila TaxID=312306 RepID=UPI0023D7BA60|nr:DUF262 domain-containing protein [Pseudomonas entomophila]MDF0731386.1 DUF262 domain-containing protein [Pseudomonas entomophila]
MSKSLGMSRVAQARDEPSVISSLSKLTGLSEEIVSDRLGSANGLTLLRNAFSDVWPTESQLGRWTVAFAKKHGLDRDLAQITGATPRAVSKRLEDAPVRMLLRNVFKDCWPDNGVSEKLDEEIIFDDVDSGESVGVEAETTSSGAIIRPFDPNKIRVKMWTPTVDLVLKRINANEIDLAPDFQRATGVWKDRAQSRLIESLLIRIPLPAFYVDGADEDRLLVIDGIQRLNALRRFVLEKGSGKRLILQDLEYLTDLEGKSFDDLPRPFQRRIEETMLTVHLIDKGTPEEAKLNIFKRLNTGGSPLTLQEIRHAMTPGPVRNYLKKLVQLPSFQQATQGRFSDDRMTDRECALRFCAFCLTPPDEYPVDADLDGFLQQAMRKINEMSEVERKALSLRFERANLAAYSVLEDEAYRKPTQNNRRSPVNKALFEAWTVGFDGRSDAELKRLVKRKATVIDGYSKIFHGSRELQEALSQGTGDQRKVRLRFAEIDGLLREVAS